MPKDSSVESTQAAARVYVSDSPSGFTVLQAWARALGAAPVPQPEGAHYKVYSAGDRLLVLPGSLDALVVGERNNKKNMQLYHILRANRDAEIVVVGRRLHVASEYCAALGLRFSEFLLDEAPFEALRANCLRIYAHLGCEGFREQLARSSDRVADVAQFYL